MSIKGSQVRSVLLLSGGLDSTVNAYKAAKESDVALAITFNYGQRAAIQETIHAQKTCSALGIGHQVITLEWMRSITTTSLVNTDFSIPEEMDLDDPEITNDTAKKVWVPNRNGVFINIAAAYAESLGAKQIVVGFNLEEAATFPDNSKAFLEASDHALSFSTANQAQVVCYTTDLNKTEIVKLGRELNVNFDNVWSCYYGEDQPCGKCESCRRFARAKGEF
ncbi:MAG: 7-cyano-7-deazaguanine synthase QueC [Bdellovibrionales bacterium]|nr:7-cyano-7-deazaguanine synthase QueC [Bdellovibrionales bacterium]